MGRAAGAVASRRNLGHRFAARWGQAGAEERQRMGAEGEAHGNVVLHHLLAQPHLGQQRGGFLDRLAFQPTRKQRQGRLGQYRFCGPERITPVQPDSGKYIRLGQPLQHRRAQPRPPPDISHLAVAIAARRG